MKLPGSSVRFSPFTVYCDRKMWLTSVSALSAGRRTFHIVCSRPVLWGFLFELLKKAEHIFIIWCSCKGSCGCVWGEVGAGWTLLTILCRLLWEILNEKWQHRKHRHTLLFHPCTLTYLFISPSRWHWRSDGTVHRSQRPNYTGNIWLLIWGKVIIFRN